MCWEQDLVAVVMVCGGVAEDVVAPTTVLAALNLLQMRDLRAFLPCGEGSSALFLHASSR